MKVFWYQLPKPILRISLAVFALMIVHINGQAETLAVWIEVTGPTKVPSIRVITSESACPQVRAAGQTLNMNVRATSDPLFPTDPVVPPAKFPVLVCELTTAVDGAIEVDGRSLHTPAEIKRIVVLGDTGCRIKGKKTQDCLDEAKWPYAAIAKQAADAKPDLVIHLGDYLYREKSCAKYPDCPAVSTGYGWDVWYADFFRPSEPLLTAAPWIMVRGNHETCKRAGEGWFRFLDGPPPEQTKPDAKCAPLSDPLVISLDTFGFVVVDSAAVAAANEDDDEGGADPMGGDLEIALRKSYDRITDKIPASAWLLTHAPFNGIRADKRSGEARIDNTILQDVLGRELPASVKMIVSGHIHLFEALNFSDGRPPQLIVGTGGDKLAQRPRHVGRLKSLRLSTHPRLFKQFGFMIWQRDDANPLKWNGALIGESGGSLAKCVLSDRQLNCTNAQ